jgi:hypothetical protein
MSFIPKDFNRRAKIEITIILIVKLIILITIKNIWFSAPTIPKNFDTQVAERIAGTPPQIKETR